MCKLGCQRKGKFVDKISSFHLHSYKLFQCVQCLADLDLLGRHQFTSNDSVLEACYWVTFLTHFLNLFPAPVTTETDIN